jgi:uncharacterized membrane protein YdbT with pleckstrin-like domain
MKASIYAIPTSLFAFVFVSLVVTVPLFVSMFLVGPGNQGAYLFFGTIALFLALSYASIFRIRYELDDNEIRLRQGIFPTWRIPLSRINRVVPTRAQAGFSFGLVECLHIQAGKRHRLVAAPDTERFMIELAARAPHLRRYGDELRGTP